MNDIRVRIHSDARRAAAVRTEGLARYLLVAQSAADDVEGAAAAGQVLTAAIQGRVVALTCASIRSLAVGGGLWGIADAVSFDYFTGLDDDDLVDVQALLACCANLDESTLEDCRALVRSVMDATAGWLDVDDELPTLRSPGGMFAALRLVRHRSALATALHLPAMIPAEWIGKTDR